MRTIRTAVLGMLAMLMFPALAEATLPAVIADRSAQRLIPGTFVHGPNMQIVVNSRWPGQRGRVTLIESDCAGAAAFGQVPKYAVRVYRSTRVETSICASPGDFSDPFPLINRAQKAEYRSRKRKARLTACRMVRSTAKKYWPKGDKPRVRHKCNRLKGFSGSRGEINLTYYGSGRRHKLKLLKFTDLGNGFGRLQYWYRDDTNRTVYLTGIL